MKDYSQIARKITRVLFLAQSLGSAGLIAGVTVNSIVGAELSGRATWAGVPAGVYQLGGAFAAFGWGYAMDRIGRRGGLTMALVLGVVGAGVAAGAISIRSFPLFLLGLVLVGSANTGLQLGRFAAAEVHLPAVRGRAISNVVIGGAVGAVVGPLLVGPTGQWVQRAGFDELIGPYTVGFVLLSLSAMTVFLWLRPDPRDVGRELAGQHPEAVPHLGPARSIPALLREPGVVVAITAMVSGQVVMMLLMAITPLHMKVNQHALSSISQVISMHAFGMFAFSVFSGRLADRWGRGPVIMVGAVTLIASCALAPLSTGVVPTAVAMFMLGLGWNFCYVGGSSLLADQLSPAERARTQGFNDLLIGLSAAMGSFGSGLVFATLGFATMGVVGATVSLVPLGLTMWWLTAKRRLAAVR